jgi:LCP family protein required for cell wall assembly
MAGADRERTRLPVRLTRAAAAVVSVLLIAGSGYGWFAYRTFGSSLTTVAGLPGSSSAASADQNILLVGDDHRPTNASPEVLAELSTGEDGGAVNTDTMMVLHLPAGGGRATVVSLPRDSWVDIPGVGKGKLNSAFADGVAGDGGDAGGMQLLIRTVQQLTGLHIDHFVRVSLLGFYQIAQVLGPLQVCLTQPAVDPLSGVDLPAGVSTLDAKQALSFVRQRHGLPRGDLDRQVRQQYFLAAELGKVTSSGVLLNPARLTELLHAVGSAVQTDPGLDLLSLATTEGSRLSPQDVAFTTIPVTGTPTLTDGNGNDVSVVAVDRRALPAFITTQVVGQPEAYRFAQAADPATVSVRVVNASGATGRARAAAGALADRGFSAVAATTAEGPQTSLTTVTYPEGMEDVAKAVADAVPGAAVTASSSVRQVTLTLGTDGRGAPPSASSQTSTSTPTPTPAGPTTTFSGGSCIN